jgi:hypothetical protein
VSPVLHLVLAAALGATTPSRSMLGVFVTGDDDTARALLDACPRVAVFSAPSNGSAAAIAAYKATCPEGIAIARVGIAGMAVVGAATLDQFRLAWQADVAALPLTPGQDGVEGPSEPVGSPAGLAAFWASFASFVNGMNLRPVVGALPSAMGGVGSAATDPFCTTVEALRFPGTLTWWWSYHARSPTMTTNALREAATSLGYRQVRADCSLVGVPLVVTEAGPAGRGWLEADAEWLAWLDARLAEDADLPGTPGVKGAAVVAAGPGANPDLAPVLAPLLAQLANAPPSDGGTPDGGVDGGSDAGSAPLGPHPGQSGPLVPTQAKGCSSGGAAAVLALAPLLLALRRRRR